MPDAALFLEHMIVDSPIHKGKDKLEFRPTNETPEHLRNLYEKRQHTKGCVVLNDFEVGYAWPVFLLTLLEYLPDIHCEIVITEKELQYL